MITKIRAPKGFRFQIVDTYNGYEIRLYDQKRKDKDWHIGRVSILKDYLPNQATDVYRTHSNLNEPYRDKKLGVRMYARAIQFALEKGFKIKSSGTSSDDARRVWNSKSLRKYFRIKHIKNKNYTNTTYGDRYDTWVAYQKRA